MTLARECFDAEYRAASAVAFAGGGPAWLWPYVERALAACLELVEAEGEAENAWRFGELLLAADEVRVMVHAWLAERAL